MSSASPIQYPPRQPSSLPAQNNRLRQEIAQLKTQLSARDEESRNYKQEVHIALTRQHQALSELFMEANKKFTRAEELKRELEDDHFRVRRMVKMAEIGRSIIIARIRDEGLEGEAFKVDLAFKGIEANDATRKKLQQMETDVKLQQQEIEVHGRHLAFRNSIAETIVQESEELIEAEVKRRVAVIEQEAFERGFQERANQLIDSTDSTPPIDKSPRYSPRPTVVSLINDAADRAAAEKNGESSDLWTPTTDSESTGEQNSEVTLGEGGGNEIVNLIDL